MDTSYVVTGMTCQHCVRHVTEEVGAIAGVTHVAIDLGTGAMTVTSDAPLLFATVAAAVAEAGDYAVVPA